MEASLQSDEHRPAKGRGAKGRGGGKGAKQASCAGEGAEGAPPRPKATRNVNLLAKSVPATCLHDFKIPFYVRRKREEERAKQLQEAKRAMTSKRTTSPGRALQVHPVGSGLPPDEAAAWAHSNSLMQNREGDELEGDDTTGGVRAELRRRLRHNVVRTVADPPTAAAAVPTHQTPVSSSSPPLATSPAAASTHQTVFSSPPLATSPARSTDSPTTTSPPREVTPEREQRKRPREQKDESRRHHHQQTQHHQQVQHHQHHTQHQHQQRQPKHQQTDQQLWMEARGRELEREVVVAASAQRAAEAVEARKVAASTATGMTTLTPMRAERAMRYAHLCGRFAEVFATYVWPFKPLHPAAWDDTTVRLVIDKGTLIAGEDEWSEDNGDDGALKDNRVLALAVFTALALGAQACGANEVALSLYEQARAHLALLFDTCDIRVAETLIALQYLAFGFGDLGRAAYYNMTALSIFNRLRAFDSDMYRRCMWSVHLLPNTSYGERKRLMREYRNNTAHLSCWSEEDDAIISAQASPPQASNARKTPDYKNTVYCGDQGPRRLPSAAPLRTGPDSLPYPATARHNVQPTVDIHQFGWGNRVLGTEPAALSPNGPSIPHPAPVLDTSPMFDDGEFGEFSYCSADFTIHPTMPEPAQPPQYHHPSLRAPPPYNQLHSVSSLSYSSTPTSSRSSSPLQAIHTSLPPSTSSSSSSSSSSASSSSPTFPVSLSMDEPPSHFASPEREIFHARYASYQPTEENARIFLHTMIILSVLDAKASRKPEGHPKRAKIFKSMAEKAIAFERLLRACRPGSMPGSYHQSVMLIMISARADSYLRMHDEIFTLVALQDFLSTCRSIDMRLCASTVLPSFNAIIGIMQQLDQPQMLAELLSLMEGPASQFPSWGQVRQREMDQLARVLQGRVAVGRSFHTSASEAPSYSC